MTKEAHLGPAWVPWQEVCREAIMSLSVDSGFGGERQNVLTMSTETTDPFLSPVMDKWNLELPNYELLRKIILGTKPHHATVPNLEQTIIEAEAVALG